MSDVTIDSLEEQPKKRPVFLTVLCILTFVGSGIGLLSALFSFLMTGQLEASYATIEQTSSDVLPSFEEYIYWTEMSNYVNIAAALACLTGAFLMFQLKKTGFYLYVLGWVIAFGFSIVSMSVLLPMTMGFGIIILVFTALIMVAFIIMYALNLKHMH